MELDPGIIAQIITAAGVLIGAVKIPDILKYFEARDKKKIEELSLHIEELKTEIKLEKEKRNTERLSHKNTMERINVSHDYLKQGNLILKMNMNIITSMLKTASLTQEEMISFIESLDDQDFLVTPAPNE